MQYLYFFNQCILELYQSKTFSFTVLLLLKNKNIIKIKVYCPSPVISMRLKWKHGIKYRHWGIDQSY